MTEPYQEARHRIVYGTASVQEADEFIGNVETERDEMAALELQAQTTAWEALGKPDGTYKTSPVERVCAELVRLQERETTRWIADAGIGTVPIGIKLKESMEAELGRLRDLASPLVGAIEAWLEQDLCDCPPEGHFCGRTERQRECEALREALEPQEPTDV